MSELKWKAELEISEEQYENAIRNALNQKHIEVLKILLAFPNSCATAKQLAEVMSPNNPHDIIANSEIGRIGSVIARYLNFTPDPYNNGKKTVPAYFSVVGPYTAKGWKMNKNLRKALRKTLKARNTPQRK